MWNLFCSYGAALLVYHGTSLEDTYETSVHKDKHGIKITHFQNDLKLVIFQPNSNMEKLNCSNFSKSKTYITV